MQKNKAVQILRTLSPEQFKRFGNFIKSPYFNTSEDVVKLFNYVKKYYPDFDNKAIEIGSAAKKFNSGKGTTEGRIRNLLTDLNLILRKFLSIEFYALSDFKMKCAEVFSLRDQNLTDIYEKELKNYFSKYGEMNSFAEPYQFETLFLSNLRIVSAFEKGNPSGDAEAFIKQSEVAGLIALDYIINCKGLSYTNKTSYNFEYNDLCTEIFKTFDFESFLSNIKDKFPASHNLIYLEYLILQMSLNVNFEENSKKAKKIFTESVVQKGKYTYWAYMFNRILNAFSSRIEKETSHERIFIITREVIAFIDFYTEQKLYKEIVPWLPITLFTVHAGYALLTGDSLWLKNYIEKSSSELKPEERSEGSNYAWAVYNYLAGNPGEALSFLSRINNSAANFMVKEKRLMLLCHCELENYETALSACDAMLRLLEKPSNDNRKKVQIEEGKLFRKFLKTALDNSPEKYAEFEFELSNATPRASFFVIKFAEKLKKK